MARFAIIVYIVGQIQDRNQPVAVPGRHRATAWDCGTAGHPGNSTAHANGDVMLSPPEKGGGFDGILREGGHFIKLFVCVVVPLLLIAAWIEARVTPCYSTSWEIMGTGKQ